MELDIEKLHNLESAVATLRANGLETIEVNHRYHSGDFSGTFYEKKEGLFVADSRAIQMITNNIIVLDTGIEYILSHGSNSTKYREVASDYFTQVFDNAKHKSVKKNPILLGHKMFSSAFGERDYDDDQFMFDGNIVIFQGLSNLLRNNLLRALRDLTVRKAYSLLFLAHSQVISAVALDFKTFKDRFNADIHNLYDRHGWSSATSFAVDEEGTEETICEINDAGYIRLAVNRSDIVDLFNANILCSDLRFNNKKVLIGAIEPVSDEEVANAAKKIKTVTDLNGVKMYRIKKGMVIKNSQEVNDYWRWRRKDVSDQKKSVGTLENHYIAVMDTPENSFKTIGTTLGRTVSSCSRQLTNKVMESLDLDDLI